MGGMPFGGSAFQGFSNMGGMPGGGTHSFQFSTSGGGRGPQPFQFSDPEDIFTRMFGGGGLFGGGGDDDFGGMPFGGADFGRASAGRRSRMNGMSGSVARERTPEVTVLEKPLAVSLEDIYNGTTKKMKIKRKKFDTVTLKQVQEDRILEVPIKPGLKAGSKIKFKDVGDQVEGGTQDLHFIVEEVSWSFYERVRNCPADWLLAETPSSF